MYDTQPKILEFEWYIVALWLVSLIIVKLQVSKWMNKEKKDWIYLLHNSKISLLRIFICWYYQLLEI